jgi:hypothetical protein
MNELKPEPTRKPTPLRPTQNDVYAASGGFWVLGGASVTAGSTILAAALFGPSVGVSTIFLLFGLWCILTAINIGKKA